MENKAYANIPAEKFQFVKDRDISHDKKLETKPVGYFRDAFGRFCKNKGSVVAAIIVLLLILFALIGPYAMSPVYTGSYGSDTDVMNYQYLLPKLSFMEGTGVWDGTQKEENVNSAIYYRYVGIQQERGGEVILSESRSGNTYTLRVDTYRSMRVFQKTLTLQQYQDLQQWQDENNMQVILPAVNSVRAQGYNTNMSVWFVSDRSGTPTLDSQGNLQPAYYTYATESARNDAYTSKMRLADDPYVNGDTENGWSYARRTGTSAAGFNYVVRVDPYNYFIYKYGFEPSFIFGTDRSGYDIFTRLAGGARFSMLFAIAVSAINLIIGAIYGAIEGYYGGAVDLTMERISDILSGLPTMVVTVLFNLHLTKYIGVVPALLYAFILTGWIGIASTTRMQFYRYKNQEYVLAARTLGARDRRLIWKHIFPNSLGTLITSSVLIIPGVIFSETSLSYLGIINLNSSSMSSVGSMLSAGQSLMTTYPHIILFPALFIALLMISFNLFGNGLRDAFNPSLRGSED